VAGVGGRGAVFRKQRRGAPAGFFETEAAGLAWLAVPGGPRVARVLDVGEGYLDLERIDSARPDAAAARDFGARLAVLHDAGADGWGVLPPGAVAGFFGPLDDPLDMLGPADLLGGEQAWPDWPSFYAQARLAPILAQGRARRVFDSSDAKLFTEVSARLPELIGPAGEDQPAHLHGDLWSGNVLWTARANGAEAVLIDPATRDLSFSSSCVAKRAQDLVPRSGPGAPQVEAVLIDPAAHGGHRECDLAMLALFGAPFLGEILAGYQQVHPLAPGWQGRIELHQLYPVAVHAVLFGGGYINQTRAILESLA